MDFTPRDYQRTIIDHMTSMKRGSVFASPGMGKTVSTLTALDVMALGAGTFPALVIGPKRVANTVWDSEVAKWNSLKGLRVVKVIGTLEQRRAALRTPADVYTTHYGLLKWLDEELQGRRWMFKSIISDESPRLKHHRCRFQKNAKSGKYHFYTGGSVNAAALMKHALETEHWYNLTGSPGANGLKDLWGPQWPIDFGKALGQNYTAFTDRWFFQRRGTSREQAVFEPYPHAADEIMALLKPTSVSVNAYDYFDVERPVERDVLLTLPDRLMKDYRTLHRDAVLKLANEAVITAVSAGSITNKCLQYASGSLLDENGTAHKIHEIKLDALDSLVTELNGEPLLVTYHYRHDKAAILKRFPQAELLPSGAVAQKITEDRWNAGQIPMLVVSPQSAGHGLNLQYGGCNVCVYTPNWDLEFYEQVIERIGPVRQAQAGLHRAVTVHRLIMDQTFDTVVADRLRSKASIQSTIMEALK